MLINYLPSYQFWTILASTTKSTFRESSRGFSISSTNRLSAASECSVGPSMIISSCIYNTISHPSSLSRGSIYTLIIAALTMSAALPWMGVLIATRSPCCLFARSL